MKVVKANIPILGTIDGLYHFSAGKLKMIGS